MPLTAAEEMKRYREKLKENPAKLEEVRKINLAQIKSKYKKITELTESERDEKRKKWKKKNENEGRKQN